jgi:hypothetical protein
MATFKSAPRQSTVGGFKFVVFGTRAADILPVTGTQWWTDYQTVSYILTSKRGSRVQFANMVSTCASAGVGVIVDGMFFFKTISPR